MEFTCADCREKPCQSNRTDAFPKGCPTASANREEVLALYDAEEREFLRRAALVESRGYGKLTRVEEIMYICHETGCKKIGLAFCVGFSEEAAAFARVLRSNGFELAAVCCKSCGIPKEEIGLKDEDKVRPGTFEAMCNPGFQADYLNRADVGFKVVLGLCVGHDSVFLRHAEGPVTVLAVKDRALGHNPLAALYCEKGYFKRLHHFIDKLVADSDGVI